jgi:hypothetical protein
MSGLKAIELSAEEAQNLRGRLLQLAPVTPILDEPVLTSILASYGIQQEVGTVNDEMARFIYDHDSGHRVARDRMRAEVVRYRGFTGVRIWAEGHERLDLRLRGLRDLLHPTFSYHPDGSVKQLVLFPESIAKIAQLHGAELVVVREWAMNTIFGGFDRTKLFYETNAWELVHNDSLRYAGLLEKRQIALIGTHDLSAHVAGMKRSAIDALQALGAESKRRFERYFGQTSDPPVYTLVLPYAAGVLLDDLAQPANYDSIGRRLVFDEVMRALDERAIDPTERRLLTRFPEGYERLIQMARDPDSEFVRDNAKEVCDALIRELELYSVDHCGKAGSASRQSSVAAPPCGSSERTNMGNRSQ